MKRALLPSGRALIRHPLQLFIRHPLQHSGMTSVLQLLCRLRADDKMRKGMLSLYNIVV
jgi:hypothetical protein